MNIKVNKKIPVEEYGYVVCSGIWSIEDEPDSEIPMTWAENLNGDYIGPVPDAEFLCKERGILPEIYDDNTVCSIGFSEKEQKWYGWSHRAIYGFGIGDKVDSEDHMCSISAWVDEYLEENPDLDRRLPVGFEAKTLEDAKKMAISFADAVS